MNAGPDVEREISDWLLEEAPMHAPDRILETAAQTIDRTKQRRFGAAWRNPMMLVTSRRLVAALFVIVAVLGAGWIGRSTASVGDGPTTTAPPSAPALSASPGPSSAPGNGVSPIAAIPEGTYAAPSMQVADIIAAINADAKLTAAQRTHLIDVALAIRNHATLTVSIDLRAGQLTWHQAVDGADIVGSRATYWFVDPNTLISRDEIGIGGFEVTRVGSGFTLKSLTPGPNEEDTFVETLFTSAPFTRVP